MLSSINSLARRARLYDSVRCLSISSARCSNEGSSDGSDDKKGRAKDRLNSLLQTIINDESLVKEDTKTAVAAPRPMFREKRAQDRRERNLGEKIVTAAEQVAQTIEGDREQNQAELLRKIVERDDQLKKSVFRAARNSTLSLLLAELNVDKENQQSPRSSTFAAMMGGDKSFSRADFMGSKSGYRMPQRRSGEASPIIDDFPYFLALTLIGIGFIEFYENPSDKMKIREGFCKATNMNIPHVDVEMLQEYLLSPDFVSFEMRGTKNQSVQSQTVDLYQGRPLGIFNPNTEYKEGPKTTAWDQCAARELKLTFTHPPRNIWEQMIMWTEKGMLWKFPIDNEQGLEKEQEVSFVDHVFLEVHLEDWCPKRGPIRQFMDLVCVGLSRNHWLSAEEKKDHIVWYKEYFLSKKELVKELGAGEFVESSQPSAVS